MRKIGACCDISQRPLAKPNGARRAGPEVSGEVRESGRNFATWCLRRALIPRGRRAVSSSTFTTKTAGESSRHPKERPVSNDWIGFRTGTIQCSGPRWPGCAFGVHLLQKPRCARPLTGQQQSVTVRSSTTCPFNRFGQKRFAPCIFPRPSFPR